MWATHRGESFYRSNLINFVVLVKRNTDITTAQPATYTTGKKNQDLKMYANQKPLYSASLVEWNTYSSIFVFSDSANLISNRMEIISVSIGSQPYSNPFMTGITKTDINK